MSTLASQGASRQIVSALAHLVRRSELRVLLICNCVLGMAVSFVLPFLSLFGTAEVKMSLREFGVFMTANALTNIAISTWFAHRSDTRYGRRTLLLCGSLAGALGYFGYAFVRVPWQLYLIGGFVLGVASLTFSQLFAYARELLDGAVPKADVPLYINAFRMAFALSWTVGPATAAFTLQHLSFVGLFCGAGSLYLLLFLLVLLFVADEKERGAVPVIPAAAPRLRAVLARRSVLLWFVALTLTMAAHTMSINNMSLLVLRVLGGDESQVGVIFSLAPVFELPLMLYVGLLATRMSAERLIRGAMLVAIAYYLSLACVRAPYQIYPLQALSAAIVSVTSGIAITFFQNRLPNQLGAATNLYSNASRIGSTSSYLTFGLVAARFGHRGTVIACAVMVITALALTALAGSSDAEPA